MKNLRLKLKTEILPNRVGQAVGALLRMTSIFLLKFFSLERKEAKSAAADKAE